MNKPPRRYDFSSRRKTFLGLTSDGFLKALFGGNALVAMFVLGLITLFLFKEGIGFFGQYRENLSLNREAGLEYTQIMRDQGDSFVALNKYLNAVRSDLGSRLAADGKSFLEVKKELRKTEGFFYDFEDLGNPLRELILDTSEIVVGARDRYLTNADMEQHREHLRAVGQGDAADAVAVESVDLDAAYQAAKSREAEFFAVNVAVAEGIARLLPQVPSLGYADLDERLSKFKRLTQVYLAESKERQSELSAYDREVGVSLSDAFQSFIFGDKWVTNSSIQDWYGLRPLLAGSLLVSFIALAIAIPLGVGAAIYVNQAAGPKEQAIIKPCIEFISAIPSVVIGFFGIAVFGSFLRTVSGMEFFDWVSFFPLGERLTAFTAGCLLALMAIPTIFTLAEDALNNVPKSFKEASLAMGATKWQTTRRVIIPSALSGVISASLLGFGRVIGETMVVLLCAGNRISVPDFTEGLGAFFQPVHTMTGIIAQELGEVVQGSIHYRALFVVGMCLFAISLFVNYFAQRIVLKYQASQG